MWQLWFFLAALLSGQEQDTALTAARTAMLSAQYCFLITVETGGQPQTRLMEPFAPDAGFHVWFGTNPKSRKVAQLRSNPLVTLAYYDPKGPNYVTLIGKARVVDNPAERRAHWRQEFEKHFPGGPDGPNYVAIEFIPSRIELVSVSMNVAATPASLRPAILDRTAHGWKLRP